MVEVVALEVEAEEAVALVASAAAAPAAVALVGVGSTTSSGYNFLAFSIIRDLASLRKETLALITIH